VKDYPIRICGKHPVNQFSESGSLGSVKDIGPGFKREAAWPSGWGAGLEIRRSRVQVPLAEDVFQ